MDIVEFFELSCGKWFSHRTSHLLSTNQSESGKSNLQIEALSNVDPGVTQLCAQYQIDSAQALYSARISWSGELNGKNQQSGSTLLVAIANPNNPKEGKLLHQIDGTDQPPTPGRYILGEDDALTLITETEDRFLEERLWFAGPNLRLRTSLLKQADGFSTASFCSEIRMGVTRPATPPSPPLG
jgi:hypothetical protein